MSHSCAPRRVRLAEGPFCLVDSCSCGTLHVSIGAITLRVAPEVAASIAETLRSALTDSPPTRTTTPDDAAAQLALSLLQRGPRGQLS